MHKLNLILIDFIFNDFKQSYIAEKHKVTNAYISVIKRKIDQLRYKPLIKNRKLLCLNCKKEGDLLFHHDHNTGQSIAIVCRGCNQKIKNKTIFKGDELNKDISLKNYLQLNSLGDQVSIQIHTDTKQELTEIKIIPRETYDGVIKRLLECYEIKQEV